MKIGDVSKLTGVPRGTIRYYEELKLIESPGRTDAGYRNYSRKVIKELRFIKRAAVELFNKLACQSCEVIIYDLREGCITNECLEKINKYGIARLPAVAVNGKLLDYCRLGEITEFDLKQAGIGSA